PHNCDMRNHYADLMQNGVSRVFGLSSQAIEYQKALAGALRLPYPLLTDEAMELATALQLPTISAGDLTVYQRHALIVNDGVIEHVFFPIFPPDQHAQVVLDWLADNPEDMSAEQ
ncbi:redoxin family protein, partial [Microbacterium saccharophilum]